MTRLRALVLSVVTTTGPAAMPIPPRWPAPTDAKQMAMLAPEETSPMTWRTFCELAELGLVDEATAHGWRASLRFGPGSHEVNWLESLESVGSPTTAHGRVRSPSHFVGSVVRRTTATHIVANWRVWAPIFFLAICFTTITVANNERLRTPDLVIATWNDVALWVGSGKADEEQIGLLHQTLDRLSETPALLLWLPHRAAAPEGKARTRAGRLFREMGARLQGFALITEGGGFWASAIRSIVTGLSLAARTRIPFKAMPAIEEAAPWLMDKMGRPEEADPLLSHATKLRSSLEQWDPPL